MTLATTGLGFALELELAPAAASEEEEEEAAAVEGEGRFVWELPPCTYLRRICTLSLSGTTVFVFVLYSLETF